MAQDLGPGAQRAREREAAVEAARLAQYERHGLRPVISGVRPVGKRKEAGIVAVRDFVRIDKP